MLAPMRYKDFTWPNNPRSYTISYERPLALHKIPQGAYALEDLGRSCRVMRGQGEFYGPQAYETFKKLATVFYDDGPGTLFHPVWMTTSAYLTELQLRQEPEEDYVAYSFTFVEGFPHKGMRQVTKGEAAAAPAEYHTLRQGETLWDVAAKTGRTVKELLEQNPQIANANTVYPGQKVRIR